MTAYLPFAVHPFVIAALVAALVLHHFAVTDHAARRRARWAILALAVVTLYPVGDIAASVSLTVATAQRLVIILLVAPLLIQSLPISVIERLTRPAPLDWLARRLSHPGLALGLVTLVGTATLIAPVVDSGARSSLIRGLTLLVVLGVGVELWIPALGVLPGTKRLSPAARAGYLFVSALLVTSLSFVWIFSQHPLYPALHHQQALLDLSPLMDQQLAGFVAKIGAYVPLWIVAFLIFFNADSDGQPVEDAPLHWADVERELLRLDRQRARALRRHPPS